MNVAPTVVIKICASWFTMTTETCIAVVVTMETMSTFWWLDVSICPPVYAFVKGKLSWPDPIYRKIPNIRRKKS